MAAICWAVSARRVVVIIALTVLIADWVCVAVRLALAPGAAPWQAAQLVAYSASPLVPVGGGVLPPLGVAAGECTTDRASSRNSLLG